MAGKMWLNVNASLVNMKIPQFRMRGEESDFEYDESFFYFVGRWLGDGWVVATKRKNRGNSIQKRVHVCCAHELADDLQARLDETGLHFCRTEEPTVTKFVCVSASLYDWLVSNFGKGADGKHLPPWVFGMPIEYREALFLGYIDSDGTPVKSGVRITSISKALTVGMKILAAGIGYTSSVVHVSNAREKCVIEGRTVNERPYFNQTYYSHSRSAVLCDSGFWGRVRKVLPGSRAVTVYNLEVEGDNSYTADGIAVHNCQSYSIAGLRQGLADPRGQLMLEFLRACSELEPEWIVGENVPGLLSADGGRAFETFLNAVAILWPRGGVAWRILDSQFVRVPDRDGDGRITGWFGPVAQRRRRVFLVINTRDWRRAAAVLLEPEGMCGNSKASGKKREELAADARRRAEVGGGRLTSFKWFQGSAAGTMPAYDDGTTPTLVNADGHVPAIAQDAESVAFAQNQRGEVRLIGGTGDHVATVAAQASPKGQGRSLVLTAPRHEPDDSTCVGFVGNYGGKTAMGVSEEVSPTVIAKHPVDVLCMAHGQANAEIEEGGVSPTLTLLHEAPIVVSESDP